MNTKTFITFLFVPITLNLCTDFEPRETLNLRRRPSIPLHQMHIETYPQSFRRAYGDNDLNFRRTRGIYVLPDKYAEAMEIVDKITSIEPDIWNEKHNDVVEMMEKVHRNNRNERIDHVVRPDRSERYKQNEKHDCLDKNSHFERLIRNVHEEKETYPPFRRKQNSENQVTQPEQQDQQELQDQRQSLLRNMQKLSHSDRKIQLDKFRKELRWMTGNADEEMGIQR